MDLLYHIAAAQDWDQAQRDGEYRMSTRGRTLAQEGFIHTSTAAQVLPVANAVYGDDQRDLLLLVLDPARITAEIRYEPVPGWADPFPHLYGPLNSEAVIQAVRLERDAAGNFLFPAAAARQ
jgi:glutathione S-transferase